MTIFQKFLYVFYGLISACKRLFNKGDTNTVLIIKQDGLGDFVLFLPIAEEIRKYYSDKKIVFCCSPPTVDLAKNCGFFDQIVCFSKRDFAPSVIGKTYRKFSRIKCDLLLHPTQPRTVEAETVAKWVNAKIKIASLGESGALPAKLKRKFDRIYDKLVDTGERNMTLVQSSNFLRELGDTGFKVGLPKIANVQVFPIALPKDFFVIFLGGSIFNKLWPPERFSQVAGHIVQKTGWECLVCGTEKDAGQLANFDDGSFRFYSLLGKTTINELIFVLSKAKMVVGNDTCAVHIANAVGVPSVCVKGQFSGEKFFPYKPEKIDKGDILPAAVCSDVQCKWCTLSDGGGYFCLHGDYFAKKKTDCILRVNVKDVIAVVDGVLDEIN